MTFIVNVLLTCILHRVAPGSTQSAVIRTVSRDGGA